MNKRVTVCQLPDDLTASGDAWLSLVHEVASQSSDIVLLPEMPFYPWLASTRDVQPGRWRASVAAHDAWLTRLGDLAPAAVIGSRPVCRSGSQLNEGFVWTRDQGYRDVHSKVYLPDEEGFWEASWYQRGPKRFDCIEVNGVRIGFLICTELWFSQHAREYAKQGIDLLVTPRATPTASVEKWVAGGRAAAVVAGAFGLSSNRGGTDARGLRWGGTGWVVDPEGRLLGRTTADVPHCTVDVDLEAARAAKLTYPRYVED